MDGPFYVDTKPPHNVTSPAAVSLTATVQTITPSAMLPILGANYFSWVGKMARIKMWGQSTSGATPGNITIQMVYGPNTNNVGTQLCGVNYAWAANAANASWMAEFLVRCRGIGPVATGLLMCQGWFFMNNSGIVLCSPTSPSAIAVDLTQPGYTIQPQFSRSGSTAETIQIHDYSVEALN